MVEKNQHFVASIPMDCSWYFDTEIEASTLSEAYDEMLGICEQTFDAFKPIWTPTRVESSVLGFEQDHSSSAFFDLSPNDQRSIELDEKEGVSFAQLETAVEDVNFPRSPVKSIYMIDVESARTKIQLVDGTVEVDRTSADLYRRWHRAQISEVPPSFDPLTVSIRFFNDRELGMPTYRLTVDTSTDIWFEDTVIGNENKLRLGDVLRELKTNLNVLTVDVYSDIFDDERLLSVLVEE